MHLWHPTFDRKTGLRHHETSKGFGHGLLAPVASYFFQVLRVSATLWDAGEWFPIHSEPNLITFESEHGVETERGTYNAHQFAKVRAKKRIVRGEHAGQCDIFVPILVGEKVVAIMVVGPFATARPTAHDVRAHWRTMTGRAGHLTDPEFASYLSATLTTLVLDGETLARFEQLLACIGELMAGQGDADAIANQAHRLGAQVEQVRLVDRTWDAVRSMVDDRSARSWHSLYHASGLRDLGLSRMADNILVGLAVGRGATTDAVDEAIRRDAFQRKCFDLARKVGDVIAGQVGDQGVVFLSAASGSVQRKRQKVLDLMDRVSALAERQFALSVHFGASVALGSVPVSRGYHAALAAAESALAQGTKMLMAESPLQRRAHSLRRLRQELTPAAEQHADLLPARFERYVQAVALQCGHRTDAARGHLDAAFERMAEALVGTGTLDRRHYVAMCDTLDRAAAEARTTSELCAAYRHAALDVSEAVRRPVPARQDRNLRRAVDHIHQHYTGPVRLGAVARVAGFTPNYFSELFKEREGMTFAQYVAGLRIERAKQLLTETVLDVRRVAELSGFNSSQYFARIFRRVLGRAPLEYRAMHRKAPRRSVKSTHGN